VDLDRRFWPIGARRNSADRVPIVARDRIAGGTCVLKLAPTSSPGLADELRQEGRQLALLEHPWLLPLRARFDNVADPWGEGSVAGFATPWIDGDPLTTALQDAPLEGRLAAFARLLDVVGYLHRSGVLHLDLKPDNALASWDPHDHTADLTLIDLGSARPLDAGPGEAGGTLGYAAPEVLSGQAASVAADVFSLGTLLYELLTDQPAFGGGDGPDIRRAVLAGEFFPVRALRPKIPTALAKLAEQMLHRRPSRRPRGIADIQSALSDAGFAPTHCPGAPPFVGRADLEGHLLSLMNRSEGGAVTLVGPEGAGRRRLARHVFESDPAPGRSRSFLDLSRGTDLLRSVDGLACTRAESLPDPESLHAWSTAAARVFRSWRGPRLAVFLGDLTEQPAHIRGAIAEVTAGLVAGGAQVLWSDSLAPDDATPLHLPPLDLDEAADMAGHFGVLSSRRVGELMTRTGGWPGPLVAALAPRPTEAVDGGRLQTGILSALAPGIPSDALAHVPETLQGLLRSLLAAGLAHWAADGRLYATVPDVTPSAEDRARAQEALQAVPPELDLLWVALSAARLGDLHRATHLFGQLTGCPDDRVTAWTELVERLSAAGVSAAHLALARLREEAGDLDGAIVLLLAMETLSASDLLRLVRALRRARRLDEAEAHLQRALLRAPTGPLWLEQARIVYARGDLDAAEAACDRAEAATPELADSTSLGLRVQIASKRFGRGLPVPEAARLVEKVEALAGSDTLPSRTLSSAGRLLTRMGDLDRGVQLLMHAARRADTEGDARASAGIRLNAGNALRQLGRGRDARRAYRDALVIAERADDQPLLLRLRYSYADLELQAGRLPTAEQQIAAFQAQALAHPDPEVRARGSLLKARLLLARDRPDEALSTVDALSADSTDREVTELSHILRARALLAMGQGEDVLDELADVATSPVPTVAAFINTMRARSHLARARRMFAEARAAVPDAPDPLLRLETGQVLLAAAGEDLDPDTFHLRRTDLDRAAKLLRGDHAARAATLRDRLLEGPGAALDGIVALTEAFHEPEEFPSALARLVSEALGAYRVLIMIRIPGLGRQMTWTELSGAEAAGIGNEVLRRIQSPDDFWLAHNAFADPHLRQTSQTVRTFELKSLLAVAIPRGDRAVGALYVDDLHRANRFGEQDVEMLQRLARAVGALLPMLSRGARRRELDEPRETLGVLLSDPERVEDLDYAVSMLSKDRPHNLLVTGPTGAGKSVLSKRIATDVLGLRGIETVVLRRADPQMLITQLTGARRGEFTGAMDREGAIQRCIRERKALFLDEVQNLDDAGQQILLPLLEVRNRHFGGLTGASVALDGTLHIILGTNVDISGSRWKSHFREDLWYRMSAVHIDLPSLADRGPESVYQYLRRMLAEHGLPAPEEVFHTRALHRTTTWTWPGNLRQLQVFADRSASVYRSTGRKINFDDLPRLGLSSKPKAKATPASSGSSATALDEAMVDHVLGALEAVGWVQKAAAAKLEMSPSRLNKFLNRHGLIDEVKRRRSAWRAGGGADTPPGSGTR